MNDLMDELYLIGLLERVDLEMRLCRVFISSRERIHPVGLSIYDELNAETKSAVQAYRDGKWRLYIKDQENEDYDPTPWCHGCGAMTKKECHCGPIADND